MDTLKTILWGLLLAIVSVNASAAENLSERSDFRDETIYFVMTTRFYDGDPYNNVLCWDNKAAQTETKDPCWRGDFKGLIEKLDYIKALGFTAFGVTPFRRQNSVERLSEQVGEFVALGVWRYALTHTRRS